MFCADLDEERSRFGPRSTAAIAVYDNELRILSCPSGIATRAYAPIEKIVTMPFAKNRLTPIGFPR
jgi:hypothetical protein